MRGVRGVSIPGLERDEDVGRGDESLFPRWCSSAQVWATNEEEEHPDKSPFRSSVRATTLFQALPSDAEMEKQVNKQKVG